MNCFLVFLSLTQTQCAAEALRAAGMACSLVRSPLSLGRGSCSHALLVRRDGLRHARAVLARAGLRPSAFEPQADSGFREVRA